MIFKVIEKQPIDEEKYELEKEILVEQLTQQKKADFLNSYIENVVSQLRRDERLVINQQLFQELTGKTI